MNRNAIIGMIHLAKSRMGWDDATYRAWLEKQTGKASCKDCSDGQISLVADLLRDMGALARPVGVPGTGGAGTDRPSQAQWRLVVKLSKACNLSGAIDDPGLKTLCARVAKIDSPRFLDRRGIQALINALDGWAASLKKRQAAGKSHPPQTA